MFSFYQKSINKKIQFKGIGLHTGKKVNMTLLPAPPNHGIIFKRIDLKTKNLIEANFLNVRDALLCTKIENEFKVSVSTIEHLMGALYGEKINNLLIEIDSSELPIMDGSAKDFIEKQSSYDENELKQSFKGETFIKHLPSEKNHLYKLILKSLWMNFCFSKLKKHGFEALLIFEKKMKKHVFKLFSFLKTEKTCF